MWCQQIHVHLRVCKASRSAQLAIIFSPLWKKKKRAVYCCRRSEKANQKSNLSSGGSHQCPVGRNGSGMNLEGAGFHRRERLGLRGRRKGGQTMGREVEIHWLCGKEAAAPWRICLKPPDHGSGEGKCWGAGPGGSAPVCPHLWGASFFFLSFKGKT